MLVCLCVCLFGPFFGGDPRKTVATIMAHPILLAPHELPELFDPGLKTSVLWNENEFVSSPKMNGNRALCVLGSLNTRGMKMHNNVHLPDMMEPLQQLASEMGWVIDMEICDPTSAHHGQLSGVLESYHRPIPDEAKVYIFDAMPEEDWRDQCIDLPFEDRILMAQQFVDILSNDRFVMLPQRPVSSGEEALELFAQDVEAGEEGSMLRTTKILSTSRSSARSKVIGGYYKHGRATSLQQVIWKLKNNFTVDGQIVEVIQRRRLREGIERTTDAFGKMERVHSLDAYELDEMVGSFKVAVNLAQISSELADKYPNCHVVTEVVFGRGFPLESRRTLWETHVQSNEYDLIGRWVEIQHTPHGAKSISRGGTLKGAKLLRFRPDREAYAGRTIHTKELSVDE